MKEIDTNGILDTCGCGERPYIEINDGIYQAMCDECGEATDKHDNSTDMMIEWNKRQRGLL